MKYLVILILSFTSGALFAQKANEAIQAGNDAYRHQQYEQAQKSYADVLKMQPANATAKYNLAAVTYRMDKQDEAVKAYDDFTRLESDAALRAKSLYNMGAVLSKQKKLEESIEAYKSALRMDPTDKEARDNLQKALMELKKKEPPKQKDDQKKKKQEQKKQQPKMNKKEAEQRLKLLEQKEKEVQQRLQKEKSKTGGSQTKDW